MLIGNPRWLPPQVIVLVIKKNNWSYVKTMSRSGSHLGITINIKNTKFVKDLPMIDA
jgi:TATA-binding protein-associated factor Taf7